jgi:hypothetical protein
MGPLLLGLLALGCAAAVPSPGWPPGAAGSVPVHVSLDTWHAMIALPRDPADGRGRFEEWGYAERAWYLGGRQGAWDALRALFWPTEAVVEVAEGDRLWAERTPQPPAEVFELRLDALALARLRAHLEASRARDEPLLVAGGSRFYRARRPYHLLHTCHVWAAAALRAAGLPLRPGVALTRHGLAAQLAEIAGEPRPAAR